MSAGFTDVSDKTRKSGLEFQAEAGPGSDWPGI